MELNIALRGILPAVVLSLALLALLVQPWRKAQPHRWAALATALAFGLAYVAGHTLLLGYAFPPETPVEWWPYAALGGVAACAGDLALGRRLVASLALRLALASGFVYAVLSRYQGYYAWSDGDLARLVASWAIPIAVAATWLERRAGSERRPLGDLAGIWIPAFGGFAFAFFKFSPSTGTSAAAIACAAGCVVCSAALWSPRRVGAAGPVACAALILALAAPLALYDSELPWKSLGPLLASPLAGLLPLGDSRGAVVTRWLVALSLAAAGAWFAHALSPASDPLYG